MSNNFFIKINKGKKGEVGETVTWIVATVIIIVVLLISIFATVTGILDFKNFNYIKKADVLASKSFFSYLLTESDAGTSVYEQLGSEDNLNEFNGVLALSIFDEFYEEEYADVWLGVQDVSEWQGPASEGGFLKNNYFGDSSSDWLNFVGSGFVEGGIIISLNTNKNVILILNDYTVKKWKEWNQGI